MEDRIIFMYRLKKVLKFSALFLLIVLIGFSIYEYIRIRPYNVKFTNITSNSVTVSWNTKFASPGSAILSDDSDFLPITIWGIGKEKYYDTRDINLAELKAMQKTFTNIKENNSLSINMEDIETKVSVKNQEQYFTHHVTISNLKPDTKYYFMIGDGILYTEINNSNAQESLVTNSIPKSIQTPKPAYGTVKDAENQGDIPVSDLKNVEDGIVYFKYVDEITKQESPTFSAPINSNGNWYMDISNAIDENGRFFTDRYSENISDIYVELTINAGKLGYWQKKIDFKNLTPVEPIILNIPNALNESNARDVLIKISSASKTEAVKGVLASSGACLAVGWCNCGAYNYETKVWDDCDACYGSASQTESVFDNRGCNGSSESAQEVVNEYDNESCAGGYALNDHIHEGGQCRICEKGSLAYAHWSTLRTCPTDNEVEENSTNDDNKDYECMSSDKNNTKYSIDFTGSNYSRTTRCLDSDGCSCKLYDGTTSQISCDSLCSQTITYTGSSCNGSKDNDTDVISLQGETSKKVKCIDPDGCVCEYDNVSSNNISVKCDEYCVAPRVAPSNTDNPCSEKKDNDTDVITVSSSGTLKCTDSDGCVCEYDNVTAHNKSISCNESCPKSTVPTKETPVKAEKLLEMNADPSKPKLCDSSSKGYDGCLCNTVDNYGKSIQVQLKNGESCKYPPQIVPTPTPGPTPSPTPTPTPTPGSTLFKKFLIKTFAQESELQYSKYIIDPVNSTISLLQPGQYIFEHNDEKYLINLTQEELSSRNGNIQIYIDTNNNDKYDEGIDSKVSDFGSVLNLGVLKQDFLYSLKEGYNFISLPFLAEDPNQRTAYGLLSYLNTEYNNSVYSISKYDGTWKITGVNGESYSGDDFQLLPGQGYIIKAKDEKIVTISGKPIIHESEEDIAPIYLTQGWNLVGIYGTNTKTYTAKSLIQSINSFEDTDFTSDNVSRWQSDKQMYEGYQLTNNSGVDIEYGFDFPINLLNSYFVKVLSGSGNWEPEIAQ